MIIVVKGCPGTNPTKFAKRLAQALLLPYYGHFDFYEPSTRMINLECGAVFTGDADLLFNFKKDEATVFSLQPGDREEAFQKALLFSRHQCFQEIMEETDKIRARVQKTARRS